MTQFQRGERVVLNDRAVYREGRGMPGTIALVWGRGRWAVVDVDHHGEVTCRTRELRHAEAPSNIGLGSLASGVGLSLAFVGAVTLLATFD